MTVNLPWVDPSRLVRCSRRPQAVDEIEQLPSRLSLSTWSAKSYPWDLVHIATVREATPRRNDSCATTPVVDHCLSRVAMNAEQPWQTRVWPAPITVPTEGSLVLRRYPAPIASSAGTLDDTLKVRSELRVEPAQSF